MVLLHGTSSSCRAWDPLIPQLAESREVVLVDFPGFGQSPPVPPGQRATPAYLAEAVIAAIAAEGLDRSHVVGHSLGGLVALEVAARTPARTVTAFCPAGAGQGLEGHWARSILIWSRLNAKAVLRWAPEFPATTFARRQGFRMYANAPLRVSPEFALQQARDVVANLAFYDVVTPEVRSWGLDRVGDIDCPITIAWGDADRLLPPRQGERYKARFPQAKLLRMRDVGHLVMTDDPRLTVDIILTATREPEAAPPAPQPAAPFTVPPPPAATDSPTPLP